MFKLILILCFFVKSTCGNKNFIFYQPDEMRAESLGCYGNKITKTPNKPFELAVIPDKINKTREVNIIQQPNLDVANLPSLGVIQSPPINSPTRVPTPQNAFKRVVFDIGRLNTSAP